MHPHYARAFFPIEDAAEFVQATRVKDLAKKYSEFITFPIFVHESRTETVEVPVEDTDEDEDDEAASAGDDDDDEEGDDDDDEEAEEGDDDDDEGDDDARFTFPWPRVLTAVVFLWR